MAIATPEDLATHLQKDLTAEETASAQQALDMATADIKNAVGQNIEVVAGDIVTLDPPLYDPLILPEAPVTAVTTVKVATVTQTYLTAYTWNRQGFVWRRYGSWGAVPRSIEVTYTHGISSADKEWPTVKSILLDYAARIFINPTSVSQENLDDYGQTHAKGEGLTGDEIDRLHKAIGRLLVA